MIDYLLSNLKKFFTSRLTYIGLVFFGLFGVLVVKLYTMQITGNTEAMIVTDSSNSYKYTKYRYNDSTRGNIYDRNGNLLAYNVSSYSVVMGNSGLSGSNAEKNEMINKLIKIIEGHGYVLETEFAIELDENGDPVFNVSGTAELRFKKNAYGLKSINALNEDQKDATAAEVYDFLKNGDSKIAMFGISDDYTKEEILKIMNIRYALFTLYPQYSQFTVCSNINEATRAAVMESLGDLPGVEIKLKTSRVYNDAQFFAHIIGYTGVVTEDEMESLNENSGDSNIYYTSDVIGKTGIEKEYDSVLRGTKGTEQLNVNSAGKVLSSDILSEPVSGNDVYLTIDRELQIACYHILENNISAILISKIVNGMSYGGKGENAATITIPIYEVYNAFISNSILDIAHFRKPDATETETAVYEKFIEKKTDVLLKLRSILEDDESVRLTEEMNDYLTYIYGLLKDDGIVVTSKVDSNDPVYKSYADGTLSLKEYLNHCITNYWIDLERFNIGDSYFDQDEVYGMILDYAFNRLQNDLSFDAMIYKVLIFNYKISGREICVLLYDQGILDYNENDYNKVKNGKVSAYDFIIDKMKALEITPGMLALEPCSGSIVITDVKTGDVLCCVTYPSYDNNKLANKIDWDYYRTLLSSKSNPLINRPTQQQTTTGSTFKPLMSFAGLGEGIITTNTRILDQGIFTEVDPSPKCWKYPGNHGSINYSEAIMHSCNYFFYKVGYNMSLDESGNYSDSLGISKIQKYASMFGFSSKSGVEIAEAQPTISSRDAVRTSIGYYHNFAPIQISRYVSALANRGTVYNMTLIDKVFNKDARVMEDNSATVYNQIDQYSDREWDLVHAGMYNVVNSSVNGLASLYGQLSVKVAGKTGTAQVSKTHPNHGLFISFAPYEDPEVSVTVVLPNGYTSGNAAKLAYEVYGLYFDDLNKEELLSGDLTTTDVTNITISD